MTEKILVLHSFRWTGCSRSSVQHLLSGIFNGRPSELSQVCGGISGGQDMQANCRF